MRRSLIVTALTLIALTALAPSAQAGTVGVTPTIRGAGSMQAVEGGNAVTCSLTNGYDDGAQSSCGRFTYEQPFEAWVWFRATPSNVPAGNWVFAGWSGCDATRGTGANTECAVHSGALTLDERQPIARFSDVQAPSISLAFIAPRSPSPVVNISFSTNDPTARFYCAIDASVFSLCSPGNFTLPEGTHTFRVNAIDPSGRGSVMASQNITVDTIAPVATLGGGPAQGSRVNTKSASFTLSANETASLFCSLDSGTLSPCGSVLNLTNLADGSHTVRLRANDGFRDSVTVTRTWTIDTVAPNTTLTEGPPATTTEATARFVFSSGDADVTGFECSHDGGPFAACVSPATVANLAPGDHTFSVRSRDSAGNVDASPATQSWRVESLDADADGVDRSLDCDDANPAIRPGATDVPDNGVDENCDGSDTKTVPPVTPAEVRVPITITVPYFGHTTKKATTFSSLSVKGVPAGATVKVTCKGKCPTKSLTITSAKGGTVALKAFRRKPLKVGTTLTIEVTKPGMMGMAKILKMRASKRPSVNTKTLP